MRALLAVAALFVASAAAGSPLVWPPVKTLSCTASTDATPISTSFTVTTSSKSAIASHAVGTYASIIKAGTASSSDASAISGVTVDVTSSDETLSLATDYSYSCQLAKTVIQCTAKSAYGVGYALETVAQLLEGPGLNCSALTLSDAPAFAHRGLRVDVGHRYFPRSTLETLVDGMAAFKLNVLNLFFAGDTAVRVPSAKYGDLTKDANGVYTSKWLRELVEYAAIRGVRVVPDMDMPAHAGGFLPLNGTKDGNVVFCSGSSSELFNDADNLTTTVLNTFVSELGSLFKDGQVYVGGSDIAPAGECDTASFASLMASVLGHVHAQSGRVAAGYEALLNDLKLTLDNSTILYANGRIVDGAAFHAADVIKAGFRAVEAAGADAALSLPSVSNTTGTAPFDFYQDFSVGVAPGDVAKMLGVSATLWTSAYCKDDKCCPTCGSAPSGEFMADRSQDSVFTESVLSVVFPEVFPTAGAAWYYEASVTEDAFSAAQDSFAKRLLNRKIAACPPGCSCKPESSCGKAYTKEVQKMPLMQFGFVFGVVLASVLFVAVLYTLYTHSAANGNKYQSVN